VSPAAFLSHGTGVRIPVAVPNQLRGFAPQTPLHAHSLALRRSLRSRGSVAELPRVAGSNLPRNPVAVPSFARPKRARATDGKPASALHRQAKDAHRSSRGSLASDRSLHASHVDELLERMAALEREVHAELNRARKEWRYRIGACLRAGASSTIADLSGAAGEINGRGLGFPDDKQTRGVGRRPRWTFRCRGLQRPETARPIRGNEAAGTNVQRSSRGEAGGSSRGIAAVHSGNEPASSGA